MLGKSDNKNSLAMGGVGDATLLCFLISDAILGIMIVREIGIFSLLILTICGALDVSSLVTTSKFVEEGN